MKRILEWIPKELKRMKTTKRKWIEIKRRKDKGGNELDEYEIAEDNRADRPHA